MYYDLIHYFENNTLVLTLLAGSILVNILFLSRYFLKKKTINKDFIDFAKEKRCFIGVGGGGSNILSDIAILDADNIFIHINSDNNALRQKQSKYKILLTSDTKKDKWGCGGNTECGLNLIDDKVRQTLQEYTKEHETVYLMATLGGGVGSGSTPVLAKYLKEIGKKVIIYVTIPFSFEGKIRLSLATTTLKELEIYSKNLIVLENDNLLKSNKGIRESFQEMSQNIYKQITLRNK